MEAKTVEQECLDVGSVVMSAFVETLGVLMPVAKRVIDLWYDENADHEKMREGFEHAGNIVFECANFAHAADALRVLKNVARNQSVLETVTEAAA